MTATENQRTPQWDAARRWAARGFPVFPCVPNDKTPLIGDWANQATTDLAVIDAWWSRFPEANVASPPHASGNFVVDVDPRHGGDLSLLDLELEHGELNPSFSTRTPSGGIHYWFKGQARSTAGALGVGIDTRGMSSSGRSGYVLLGGSRIDGNSYETLGDLSENRPAPAWLTAALDAPRCVALPANPNAKIDDPLNVAEVSRLLRERATDDGFVMAGYANDYALSHDTFARLMNEIVQPMWAGERGPATEEQVDLWYEHARRYAQNGFGAKAHRFGFDEFHGLIPPTQKPKVSRFHFLTREEILAIPEPKWLMPSWMPARGVGIWYGAKNSYKSFTVSEATLALARGGKKVVQLMGEGGGCGLKRRLGGWETARGCKIPATFYPCAALPNARDRADLDDLHAQIDKLPKPDVIVMDTITRMLAGLDTDFVGMGLAYEAMAITAEKYDCLVIGVGHSGKDAKQGLMGSSVAFLNADVVVTVEGERDTCTAVWTCTHMRDGESGQTQAWQGQLVEAPSGRSLVFDPMSKAEHDAALPKNQKKGLEPREVLTALTNMGRVEGRTTETEALAHELVSMVPDLAEEERDSYARGMVRSLKRAAKGSLLPFVKRSEPLRWGL